MENAALASNMSVDRPRLVIVIPVGVTPDAVRRLARPFGDASDRVPIADYA